MFPFCSLFLTKVFPLKCSFWVYIDGTQFDENGEEVDMEWEGDEVFDDIEDIQDFCGEEDLAVLSMDVYKKIFDVFTGEHE